jgi:plastocyanin
VCRCDRPCPSLPRRARQPGPRRTAPCPIAPFAWKGNVMAAPNIGHSIIRVVNFFVVVLVALILLNLLAQPITNAIPSAGQNVSAIIGGLWQGVKNITPNLANAAAGNNAAVAPTNTVVAPTAATVMITDSAFPPSLVVAAGATITVVNQGLLAHTVTVTANGRSFSSGSIPSRQSREITAPNSQGMYTYYVDTPSSAGTLTVS